MARILPDALPADALRSATHGRAERRPRPPASRLPAVLAVAGSVDDRHLDAIARTGVAGARADALAAAARPRQRAPVRSIPAVFVPRRCRGRSRAEAAAPHLDAG